MSELTIPGFAADPFTRDNIRNGIAFAGEMRETAPVVLLEKYGCYATGRHSFATAILSNWKAFTSQIKAFGPRPFIQSILVAEDPPEHTRVRQPMMKLFTPVALSRYRERFDREAEALVDRVLQMGTVDAVADLGAAFVLKVFPDLLGISEKGREHLVPYGDICFNSSMPLNDIYEHSLAQSAESIAWVERQCDRAAVTSDGLAAEIYAMGDRGEITADDATMMVRVMLAAGYDTTILSLVGGLYAFSRFPDQWDQLRADPSLAKNAFEESVRFDPPSRFLGRGVSEDIEVEGVQFKKGDRIACFLSGAGRDPRRWQNPDSFDLQRKTGGHVSFGHGIHMCLGQAMARLEFISLFTALAKRVKRIEPMGEPSRIINNQACGYEHLPLKLHAE
ncbi:cytochrome P450 [soil metagenome]